MLYIELFGGLRVRNDDDPPVDLPPQQAGALLADLALNLNRDVPREVLIDLFWPDDDPETARHKLRNCLYDLRRRLPIPAEEVDGVLTASRTTVKLDGLFVRTDVIQFEEALSAAAHEQEPEKRIERLSLAERLYRGELLPGFYQDFIVTERNRLAEAHRASLLALARAYEETGSVGRALDAARRAVSLDPLREEAHCELMRLYAAAGQPSAVLRQYQELERVLKDELGEVPSEPARRLMESLRHTGSTLAARRAGEMPISTGPARQPAAQPSRDPALTARTKKPLRPRLTTVLVAAALSILLGILWYGRAAHTRKTNRAATANQVETGGRELWVQRFPKLPGDKDSEPTGITTDPAGNIYITGFVQAAKTDVDYVTLKYAPDGKFLWQARYQGPKYDAPKHDLDRARSITVDRHGDVYVTGESDNGKGNGTERLAGLDFATVKYDGRTGKQLWAQPYNHPADGNDGGLKVAIDSQGNVVVVGECITTTRYAPVSRECVVLKYSPGGAKLWGSHFNGPNEVNDAEDMALDADDNIYVVGGTMGHTGFRRHYDFLTLKYDSAGALQWANRASGPAPGDAVARSLAIDAQGNVTVIGDCYGGDPLNGGTGDNWMTVRYAPDGARLWKQVLAASGRPKTLAVDRSGNALGVGQGADHWLAVKYDASGNEQWRRPYHGESNYMDAAKSVVADAQGNFVVTGFSCNSQKSAGMVDADFTTIKYAPDRRVLWLRRYDCRHDVDVANALAIDRSGNTIIAGQSADGKSKDIVVIKYSP